MTKISQTAATWLTTVTLSIVARVNAGTNSDAGSSDQRIATAGTFLAG